MKKIFRLGVLLFAITMIACQTDPYAELSVPIPIPDEVTTLDDATALDGKSLATRAASVQSGDVLTTIYTPKGTEVTRFPTYIRDEVYVGNYLQQAWDEFNTVLNQYSGAALYAYTGNIPTTTYNCHNFAWRMEGDLGSPAERVWMGLGTFFDPQNYLADGSFTEITRSQLQVGDIVWYAGDHSAVVTNAGSLQVISKWGPWPVVTHPINSCPYYSSDSDLRYYRRMNALSGVSISGPNYAPLNSPVTYSVSGNMPPRAQIMNWKVDGNVVSAQGNLSYTFTQNKLYTIALRVRLADTSQKEITRTVDLRNVPSITGTISTTQGSENAYSIDPNTVPSGVTFAHWYIHQNDFRLPRQPNDPTNYAPTANPLYIIFERAQRYTIDAYFNVPGISNPVRLATKEINVNMNFSGSISGPSSVTQGAQTRYTFSPWPLPQGVSFRGWSVTPQSIPLPPGSFLGRYEIVSQSSNELFVRFLDADRPYTVQASFSLPDGTVRSFSMGVTTQASSLATPIIYAINPAGRRDTYGNPMIVLDWAGQCDFGFGVTNLDTLVTYEWEITHGPVEISGRMMQDVKIRTLNPNGLPSGGSYSEMMSVRCRAASNSSSALSPWSQWMNITVTGW